MKRKFMLITVALLMTAFAPLLHAEVGAVSYTATYNQSPQLGSDTLGGVTYTTVTYGDLFNTGEPGKPYLPVDYIKFSVPYNATNFTVAATISNNTTYSIAHPVYPSQLPYIPNDSIPPVITPPDNTVYNSGHYYPSISQMAWVADEGFLAGENHIVTVAVVPFSYQRFITSERLRMSQTVSLTLSYELGNTPALYPIVGLSSEERAAGQLLAQSMVVNPNNVPLFAPDPLIPNSLHAPYQAPAVNSGLEKFPYLIITTPELTHSLRRIAALKRQKGYNVKMVTVDEIMNDPYAQYGDVVPVNGVPTATFNDSAGSIREYLKLAYYYNSSRYLLIAGTYVPYRITQKGTPLGTYFVPNDLYYSDLNSNWFGSNDSIDRFPEIYVGRILAKNESQILNYSDKLLRYELNPGKGNFSYLNRALYTESLGHFDQSRTIGKWMNQICPDSTLIREHKNQDYPKARDIIDSINTNQYGFWGIFNHADPSCIAAYGVNFWGNVYADNYYRLWAIDTYKKTNHYSDYETDNGLNKIDNRDYPMISYTISCKSMPFNLLPKFKKIPMNVGESFTTGRNYGGPAYLGNTQDGINPLSSYFAESFAKRLSDSKYKIGMAEALSKTDNYDDSFDLYISLSHNLLGDPTLEIWSDTPQLYSNIEISRSNNSVLITGIDADSTIVAYYSNEGQIGTDTISDSTVTINGISPNSSIMLYKHNFIPYIAPMELQNTTLSNSQYVIASDVKAGGAINSNRTNGYVIVPDGVEYEIEATGTITLEDGFKVEKGATFAVYRSSF